MTVLEARQTLVTSSGGGGGAVNSVSGTSPVVSSGGADPFISMPKATNSVSGYLSAADFNVFEGKQNGGNYVTQLTGDVTGTISSTGPIATSLTNNPLRRYVDFTNGNDSGTGSIASPWKTLQNAYNQITTATSLLPFTVFISGGATTDTGIVTGKPNIYLFSESRATFSRPINIIGGTNSDIIYIQNLVISNSFTWDRNDNTNYTLRAKDTSFSTLNINQTGSGNASMSLYACQSAFLYVRIKGFAIFVDHVFTSVATFEDGGFFNFYEFIGGYSTAGMTIKGGVYPAYFIGFLHDTFFGASLTCVNTVSGSPNIFSDSGSLPSTITGTFLLTYDAFSKYLSYTPTTSSNWSSVPVNVQDALDLISNAIPVGGGWSLRPTTALVNGVIYFDTGLKKPFWYNVLDANWYDADGIVHP